MGVLHVIKIVQMAPNRTKHHKYLMNLFFLKLYCDCFGFILRNITGGGGFRRLPNTYDVFCFGVQITGVFRRLPNTSVFYVKWPIVSIMNV